MNYPEGPSLGPFDISDSFPKFTGMLGHQKSFSMSSFIVSQAADFSTKKADKDRNFMRENYFFKYLIPFWTNGRCQLKSSLF